MAKLHAPGSVHKALDDLMKEVGAKVGFDGYEAAADFENVTKWTLYKQVDPDNPVEMSFARVSRLSAHFGGMSALKYLADQVGCVVIERSQVGADANLLSLVVKISCESHQSVQAIAESLADGVETEEEFDTMEKEVSELEAVAAAARLAIRAKRDALRKNVTKTRGAA